MRRMSFALTTEQILNQTKTITRRKGWKHLQPGDLIQPVEKCMGLKKGEKQQLLGGPIRIKSISVQRLYQISAMDIILEGFPNMTRPEFIDMYCKANGGDSSQRCSRIEFEYTEPLKSKI